MENPDKSRIDEMLTFAEKAEREYMAEAAAYVQTPADIAEQAQTVPRDTFSIYQLKSGNETLDYRFEPLDAIRNNGLSVKPENYEQVYTAPLTERIVWRASIPDLISTALQTSRDTLCLYPILWCCIRTGRIPLITVTVSAFPRCQSFAAGTGSGGHDPHAGSNGDTGADQHPQRQLLCDQYDTGTDGSGRIWGSPSV